MSVLGYVPNYQGKTGDAPTFVSPAPNGGQANLDAYAAYLSMPSPVSTLPNINWNPAQTEPINYTGAYSKFAVRPGWVDDPNNKFVGQTDAYVRGETIYPGSGNPLRGTGMSNGQAIEGIDRHKYRDARNVFGFVNGMGMNNLNAATNYMPQITNNFQNAAQDIVNSRLSQDRQQESRDYLQAAQNRLLERMNTAYLL